MKQRKYCKNIRADFTAGYFVLMVFLLSFLAALGCNAQKKASQDLKSIDESEIGLDWSLDQILDYMKERSISFHIDDGKDGLPKRVYFYPVRFQGFNGVFEYDLKDSRIKMSFGIPAAGDPKKSFSFLEDSSAFRKIDTLSTAAVETYKTYFSKKYDSDSKTIEEDPHIEQYSYSNDKSKVLLTLTGHDFDIIWSKNNNKER